ncbi:MAG TPA: hypothetical protein VNM40_00100 [Candidatus Paceibacterota bacterium]|nr:hypothetical protein [Candidatus Paceibacterota bacterium]
MDTKVIRLVYNVGHIERTEVRGHVVLACTKEVELALESQGISFVSIATYREDCSHTCLREAEEYVQNLITSDEWSFFEYRSVDLGRVFAMTLQVFLAEALYWTKLLSRALDDVPPGTRVEVIEMPLRSGSLNEFRSIVFSKCARVLCARRGLEYAPRAGRASLNHLAISIGGTVIRMGFSLYNAAVATFSRRRPLMLVGSELWKNIAPLMRALPDAELVLLDRGEIRTMGLHEAWRHRVRFAHLDEYAGREAQGKTDAAAKALYSRWQDARKVLPEIRSGEESLTAVVAEAIDHLFLTDVPEALVMIEGAYALMQRRQPDVVVLRATSSRQPHFSILAFVARALGIPAIEIQHGGHEFLPDGSLSRKNHTAEHLAVYGHLIRDEMRAVGYRGTIHPVGSPRFDVYERLHKRPHDGLVVTCFAPTDLYISEWDTYEVFRWLSDVAESLRALPNAQVIVKLKPGLPHRAFYRAAIDRVLSGTRYKIDESTPLTTLLAETDIAISSNSTVILESMMARVPVILAAFHSWEVAIAQRHHSLYERDGGLLIARSGDELRDQLAVLATDAKARESLAARGYTSIHAHHSFDGHASERLAGVIRKLASDSKHTKAS